VLKHLLENAKLTVCYKRGLYNKIYYNVCKELNMIIKGIPKKMIIKGTKEKKRKNSIWCCLKKGVLNMILTTSITYRCLDNSNSILTTEALRLFYINDL